MVKYEGKTLLELIQEYSKLQATADADADELYRIGAKIREDLWVTGEIESMVREKAAELEQDLRKHRHHEGKVVRDY